MTSTTPPRAVQPAPVGPGEPVFVLRNVAYTYAGRQVALDDIDLTSWPGDYDAYRQQHRQLLHDYLSRFVVHGGVNPTQ